MVEINNALEENLHSIQQAIGIVTLQKAMNKDASTVAALLNGMQAANARMMELSVTPYKGQSIDARV